MGTTITRRFLTVLLACAAAAPLAAAEQPTIRSEADLPPTRYTLDAAPSAAFLDDRFLAETVPALRAEAEAVLATSRIDDPVIAGTLRNGLGWVALLQNRPADAQRSFAEQRARETKPQFRALGQAKLDAIAAGLAAPAARRCAVTAERMRALLRAADPATAREAIVITAAGIQVDSDEYHGGTVAQFIDPTAATRGSVSLLQGLDMARYRAQARLVPPCRAELTAVMRGWLDDPSHQVHDIWPAREPAEQSFAAAGPVTVAVWDGGLDITLFPGQLAIDPAEPLDGRDNDGNGVVDDSYGPTYTSHLLPDPALLDLPSPALRSRLAFQIVNDKGAHDLYSGEDTPEARFAAERGRNASVAEQKSDVEQTQEQSARNHGTEVASIIADGLPFVRLYNVRALPFDIVPGAPHSGEPEFRRFAELIPVVAARMRGAGVRVANISWGLAEQELIDDLLNGGFEHDPAVARAKARTLYEQVREALTDAITRSPDILFVVGAGNSDQPDDVLGDVPQTLHLPNMIVVGATGATGAPTNFTTFGKLVDVYARGTRVPVRLAGGQALTSQGTSFSAPLVARIAAEMLAVNPGLAPADLIAGIKATATSGADGMLLVHAAHAVDWARAGRR